MGNGTVMGGRRWRGWWSIWGMRGWGRGRGRRWVGGMVLVVLVRMVMVVVVGMVLVVVVGMGMGLAAEVRTLLLRRC